jgi:hypothetical protein
MPDSFGSLARRAAIVACVVFGLPAHAVAQQPLADPPRSVQFLSRYDLHLSAAGLASADDRFSWDTHWGGDFDFVDYVRGRWSFLADYQAVLGKEIRAFDPNQGNYTLAVSSSLRLGGTELAGVYHHVSRHLADRPKTVAIAMNAVLARVLRQVEAGGQTVQLRLDAGRVVQRAYVDYTWMAAGDVNVRRQVSPRVAVYGRGYGETYAVNGSVPNRGTQAGGRIEGGVRLSGRGGVLELFGGYERVLDASPLDRQAQRWAFAGFRLLNR